MHESTTSRLRRVFSDLEALAGRLEEIDEAGPLQPELSPPRGRDLLAGAAFEGKRVAIAHGLSGLSKIRHGRESQLTEVEEWATIVDTEGSAMDAFSRERILAGIRDGVQAAFAEHREWSGGEWLDKAPEWFLTYHVAAKMFAATGSVLSFESLYREVRAAAGSETRGRPARDAYAGRIDLAFWNDNDEPIILFEIKRAFSDGDIDADAGRLRLLLKDHTSVEYAYLVAYTDAEKEKTVLARLNNMAGSSRASLVLHEIHTPQLDNPKGSVWGFGVFEVQS